MNKKTGEIPFGLEMLLEGEFELEKVIRREIKNPNFSDHIRPYQKESLEVFFKNNFGIIKVPTGGGKTVIATEAMNILLDVFGKDYRCLFIVDQVDLLRQSCKRFTSSLPDYKVGIYTKGKLRDYKDYQVIVCTIQTLQSVLNNKVKRTKKYKGREVNKSKKEYEDDVLSSNLEKSFLSELLGSVRCTIIDEVQFFGSKDRSELIMKHLDNTEYLLALSATPLRSDDIIASKRIVGFTGGVIYQIKEQVLVDDKFLADRRVLILYHQTNDIEKYLNGVNVKKVFKRVNDNGEREYTDIPRYTDFYKNFIIKNKDRNQLILDTIEAIRRFNRNALILVSRRSHGILLSKKTGIKFIDGNTMSDERKLSIDNLQGGTGNILIASGIFNKGIDIPEINIVFNAGAGKNEENSIQKKGRVLRRVAGNPMYDKAMIIDIYDDVPKTFGDHSDLRLAAYIKDVDSSNVTYVEYLKNSRAFIKQVRQEFEIWFNEK